MSNITNDKELIEMAAELSKARKILKEAAEKEKDIKEKFKIEMNKRKIKVLIAGEYCLTIRTQQNTVTDWTKIQEDLGDKFKKYQTKGKLQKKLFVDLVK